MKLSAQHALLPHPNCRWLSLWAAMGNAHTLLPTLPALLHHHLTCIYTCIPSLKTNLSTCIGSHHLGPFQKHSSPTITLPIYFNIDISLNTTHLSILKTLKKNPPSTLTFLLSIFSYHNITSCVLKITAHFCNTHHPSLSFDNSLPWPTHLSSDLLSDANGHLFLLNLMNILISSDLTSQHFTLSISPWKKLT